MTEERALAVATCADCGASGVGLVGIEAWRSALLNEGLLEGVPDE